MSPVVMSLALLAAAAPAPGRWSEERAQAWAKSQPWLVGSNFLPAYAINQLEMWQPETFDAAAVDRELGWAESLGFTSMRVFLHDVPHRDDPEGFLKRVDQVLGLAEKHKIGAMLVLFDSCWDPFPKSGKQRDPKPGVHNSGWVQNPGKEVLENPGPHMARLEAYVKGVVGRFKDDKRVQVWDVWNEPDNTNGSSYGKQEPKEKPAKVLPLLKQAFAWCREAGATQPLTSGVWIGTWGDANKLNPTERVQLENSDVISFHNYDKPEKLAEAINNLKRYNRPMLCTEYMARGNHSFFDPHLAQMKAAGVGAYNWGFTAGKSQTNYPWDSWQKPYNGEPPLWFHDIFRADGTPYRPAEVEYIRRVTGKQ